MPIEELKQTLEKFREARGVAERLNLYVLTELDFQVRKLELQLKQLQNYQPLNKRKPWA